MSGDGCFPFAMDTAVDEESIAQPAEEPPTIPAISGDLRSLAENDGVAVPNDEGTLAFAIDRRQGISCVDHIYGHGSPTR
jgi:hypothetical protein